MPTPAETEALLLSLRVAVWSVLGSLPPAIAIAWLLARTRFPGHALLNGLLHIPLVVPPVVIGYLLLVFLGRRGPGGVFLENVFGITLGFTWQGAAVASAIVAFPLMLRAIRQSIEAVDRRLEQAARTLGASSANAFCTVTLPLIAPGVFAGMVLSFARSLGEFGATITFVSSIPGETRTLPLALYAATQVPGGEPQAMRLVIISVALAMIALVGSEWLARRTRHYASGGP
jgi:molybdate transport system permease protein